MLNSVAVAKQNDSLFLMRFGRGGMDIWVFMAGNADIADNAEERLAHTLPNP
jgi:hypothetical protein